MIDPSSHKHVTARRERETALPVPAVYVPTGEEIPGVLIGQIGIRGAGWSSIWATLAEAFDEPEPSA